MKPQRVYTLCVFILAFATLASCAAPPLPTLPPPTSTATLQPATPTTRPFGGRVDKGQLTSSALAGNLLGDPATRDYYVYLPPGYDTSTKRYPVVYVLHWFTGNARQWLGSLPNAMDWAIDKGEVKDTILVFPDASNKLGGSMYMTSPTIGDYETYITKELVAKVDSTYRTLANRDSRGIMGCSMGGLGTLHLALKYPEVYGVAVAMSGLQLYVPELHDIWEAARSLYREPKDLADIATLDMTSQFALALSAVAAPNPSNTTFFFDMPFKMVNGEAQDDSEVLRKVKSLEVTNDIQRYIAQPMRLNGLLVYIDTDMGSEPASVQRYLEHAASFDLLLTESGLPHEFVSVDAEHCNYDVTPILQFMDAHLAY